MTNDRRDLARRLVFPTAILGAAWVVGLTLWGGFTFPGYDHLSQFISELGAKEAPHELAIRFGGFLPAGLLLCGFALAAARAFPSSGPARYGFAGLGLFAFGYLVAVAFPCDPGCRPVEPSLAQVLHNLGGLAGYLLAPISLVALGIAARRWGHPRLAALGFVLAVTAFAGLAGLSPESPLVGLSQRLLEASVLLWIVACGFTARSIRARRAGRGTD